MRAVLAPRPSGKSPVPVSYRENFQGVVCFSGHSKPVGKESQAVNYWEARWGPGYASFITFLAPPCLGTCTPGYTWEDGRARSPLQDSFSKCERCFVAGSTFRRNKPGKTKFCQGDAHPVLTLWGVKSQSFAFFLFPVLNGMWDLSSPTRGQICNPCSGSMES